LPPDEWQRWLPQLEHVDMPLGEVLYESGTTLSHVYFPTTSIVSLLYVMENGASAEIAVVGNEGVVGISLFMGGESTPSVFGSAQWKIVLGLEHDERDESRWAWPHEMSGSVSTLRRGRRSTIGAREKLVCTEPHAAQPGFSWELTGRLTPINAVRSTEA
jgi:hypothetical protein